MKTLPTALLFLAFATRFPLTAKGDERHFWTVTSPDHGQTFAYGTEKDRVWTQRGRHHQLALLLKFTNDPFVDWEHPREYDNFTFSFPSVSLAGDGRTYIYRTTSGHEIPVALRFKDFLGITEIHLEPNVQLQVNSPHGYLSLRLVVEDVVQTAAR